MGAKPREPRVYITLEALREQGACQSGIDAFIETFGLEAAERGVALTRANLEKMPHSRWWGAEVFQYTGWLSRWPMSPDDLSYYENGVERAVWEGFIDAKVNGLWVEPMSRSAFIAAVRAARQRPGRAVPKRRPASRRVRGSEA